MTEFRREPRYIVFKISDLKKYIAADFEAIETLSAFLDHISAGRAADGKQPFSAVVVEQDWPEFEPTWAAIKARMTGCTPPNDDPCPPVLTPPYGPGPQRWTTP